MRLYPTYRRCKRCGDFEGPISARGLCQPCGLEGTRNAIYAMADREGPTYQRWRAQMIEWHRRALAELEAEESPRSGDDTEVESCLAVDGRRPTW